MGGTLNRKFWRLEIDYSDAKLDWNWIIDLGDATLFPEEQIDKAERTAS